MSYFDEMKTRMEMLCDKEDVFILGIETSCDETAAAVVRNGRDVVSSSVFSQIDMHKKFGGVVPEIASRQHVLSILPVIDDAISNCQGGWDSIDAIAVTKGPGLVGALLSGVSTAKALAYAKKLPLIGVNHIQGHICANFIENKDLEPPFVCLAASGGHSHLYHVKAYGEFELLGSTVDDAAGEALDKAARVLGLPYPGGPNIEELAKQGDPDKYPMPGKYNKQQHFNFSFSGLKTAMITLVRQMEKDNIPFEKADIAAAFQEAVVSTLAKKAVRAAKHVGVDSVAICGGVSANSELRRRLKELCDEEGLACYMPSMSLCTDNACMIASAGYFQMKLGNIEDLALNAQPGLRM